MFVNHRAGLLGLLGLCLALWLPWVGAVPPIASWQTTAGSRVLFVAAPEPRMLDIRIVFDAGSARSATLPGLSTLTNALLIEGAGDWNADQFAERNANAGIQMGQGALRDMAWVSVRTLVEPKALETALESLATVLARPRFAITDIERKLQGMRVALKQTEQDPGALGKREFLKRLYGHHPYSTPPEGNPESLSRIQREDIVAFYNRYYTARNAVVAMVGALDQTQAERVAARVMAGLPMGETAPALPPVPELTGPVLETIPFPSSQAHLYAGQPSLRRSDEDYFPLLVGNHILGGGGLVSLLAEEVREKRGLSYSVSSSFVPMRQRGPFMIGLQTRLDQGEQAEQVALDTLRRFRDQGPTPEELTAAKRHLSGGFPLQIASNGKMIENIAMIGFYGLAPDYLDHYVAHIEAVSAEQIRETFQQRLNPERMLRVRVGSPDPKKAARASNMASE
ncbi:Insulinase family protein [Gammaproteobacteria bacterium]